MKTKIEQGDSTVCLKVMVVLALDDEGLPPNTGCALSNYVTAAKWGQATTNCFADARQNLHLYLSIPISR